MGFGGSPTEMGINNLTSSISLSFKLLVQLLTKNVDSNTIWVLPGEGEGQIGDPSRECLVCGRAQGWSLLLWAIPCASANKNADSTYNILFLLHSNHFLIKKSVSKVYCP